MLSAFASLFAGGEDEVRALAAALPDPAGTFWRYALAAGLVPPRPPRPPRGPEGAE
jgi:F420-non-reducing hydrogenase small subunit